MVVQDKKLKEVRKEMEEIYICCVCGEEHKDENIHHIDVKGETKDICKGCATSIKGLA